MIGEALQRPVQVGGCGRRLTGALLEPRKDDRAAEAAERRRKGSVSFRSGGGAEIDIEGRCTRPRLLQAIEQPGVQLPRPRPHTDRVDRPGVDRDEYDL